MINSEVYCHQLEKLNDALQQKRSELINRKGVVFHQDNARPHTSLVTRQKLLQLEWDTMPHPPYSPDLAPSDYYLFRSLQNFLDGKTFISNEEDERHGVVTTSCRISQNWNDVHLRWNASDFGGVTTVRIPAAQIWRPDVILRNNADPSSPSNIGEEHAVLKSSGDITWTSQVLLKSACTLDLRFFPFDFHLCHLNFTSWSYDIQQVTLTAERVDLSNFHPNPEFHLEDVLLSPGGGRALAFSLIVRRRPGPPLLRHVLPCFVVTALAALTFLVPPASGERVTLAVGCLLALLLVSVATGGGPRASAPQLPLLGVYQLCCLCLVSSVAFLSAMTLGLHSKGADGIPPSPWLRKCILGCLAPMLFVHPCPQRKDSMNFQVSLRKRNNYRRTSFIRINWDRIPFG
ncbi:ligand-gated ion channel 4 [Trichonephila clavipes]|nr:ligand-gated ion channel 4 [Trichonephila clavipes]